MCSFGYVYTILFAISSHIQITDASSTVANLPKIATTVIVIFGCVIIAVIVSLIFNFCCICKNDKDKDESSIDDKTRKLLNARLALIQMQKRKEIQRNTLKFFKVWSKKSISNPMKRKLNRENSVVIDVDEASDKNTSNNVKNGGSIATLIKGNKVSNGSPKAPLSPRQSASVFPSCKDTSTSKMSSPASSIHSYSSSFISSESQPSAVVKSSQSKETNSPIKSPKSTGDSKKRKNVTFNENVQVQSTE